MAKAIQTVCVCVCVCTCLSVFCVFVWLYLWSVGGEKLYRQRRSGGSAPIVFRPIAASLVIGNSANHVRRDRSHMCKDNAMTIQRQCKGCISSFNCLIPSRVNWSIQCIFSPSSTLAANLPAGWVHVKNRRHHQNTKHQSSPMSYTPDIILILDCKKRTTNIAISSGNKICELAGWNDFIIDIHLIHGSVQMFKSFEFKLLINFSHLRRFPLSNNYPPE